MESMIIAALVIVAALIVLFVTKFLAPIFKMITKIILLIVILLAITTIMIYKDLNELQEDITHKKSIFLLKENGHAYAAVGIDATNGTTFDFDSFIYFTEEELKELDSAIENGRQDDGIGRIFIVTPNLINKSYNIEVLVELDENDIIEILKSGEPHSTLANKADPRYAYTPENLANAYGHEGILKGYLLAASIINYFHESDGNLVDDLKSGDMKVIPETITFKIVRWLPI